MDGTKPPGEGIRRRGMVTGHGGMATKKDAGHRAQHPLWLLMENCALREGRGFVLQQMLVSGVIWCTSALGDEPP